MILRRSLLAAVAAVPFPAVAERTLKPLSEVLNATDPPADLDDAPFYDADNAVHRISEFRGRGMVVNMWATWCAPCVAEMPALQALSRALAPADIAVLPLSSDRGGASVVRKWYEDHEISGLPVLTDPKGVLATAWGAKGLPTTVIVGRDGRERARLTGPAEWGTPEAAALIVALANRR